MRMMRIRVDIYLLQRPTCSSVCKFLPLGPCSRLLQRLLLDSGDQDDGDNNDDDDVAGDEGDGDHEDDGGDSGDNGDNCLVCSLKKSNIFLFSL